ncbi:hypothetical protein [Deinococcus aestuarii]|uniref:hypothetical protein n=1 Tax=Deinococcus aestuarii TaxID=2774531 RepID=UPI001C0E5621|nr:hypothetical protein [Deinococcus aestuarii]
MTVTLQDAISFGDLSFVKDDFDQIKKVCPNLMGSVVNRSNLPGRTQLEKMHHLIMGELSELATIKYLRSNGRFAESAVDKMSGRPDLGHDVRFKNESGKDLLCSVKSSNSHSYGWPNIIDRMHFPFTKDEVKDINVRAYYRLPSTRETLSDSEKASREDAAENGSIFVEIKNTRRGDTAEFAVVEAITLHNMERLYSYGKLLAIASRRMLNEAGFRRSFDEYLGIEREMSVLKIKDGRTMRELLDVCQRVEPT